MFVLHCRLNSPVRKSFNIYHSTCSWRPNFDLPSRLGRNLYGNAFGVLHPPCVLLVTGNPFRTIRGHRNVSYTPKRSYYDVLGVPRTASAKDIKGAYYELSKKFHPDLNQGHLATVKFQEISEAYETLGNAINRRNYDERHGDPDYRSNTAGDPNPSRNRYRETEMPGERTRTNWNRSNRKYQTSGKTDYWDYDEYYRQHYHDVRQRQHNEKQWENFNETRRHDPFRYQRTYSEESTDRPPRGVGLGSFILTLWILMSLISMLLPTRQPPPYPNRDPVHYPPHRPVFYNNAFTEEAILRERARQRLNNRFRTWNQADDVELPPLDREVSQRVASAKDEPSSSPS